MYGEREHGREEYDIYKERPSHLSRFSDLDDWAMNEGDPDIRGWNIYDRDDNSIGKVDDLLVDTDTGNIIFAIASYGGALGIGAEHTLVPLDRMHLDRDNERVHLMGTEDDLHNAPKHTRDTHDFGQYYDYWSGRPAAEAAPPRERHEEERPEMRERRGQVIPEVEEHLEAEKREVETGEVEVRKVVETHKETVREPVRRTRIRVIRRGVEPGREVKPGEQVLREGETLEIPVVEERLDVHKRAEVTGEVIIQPETVVEEETVSGEVRKEHVEVEAHGEAEVEEEEERTRRERG